MREKTVSTNGTNGCHRNYNEVLKITAIVVVKQRTFKWKDKRILNSPNICILTHCILMRTVHTYSLIIGSDLKTNWYASTYIRCKWRIRSKTDKVDPLRHSSMSLRFNVFILHHKMMNKKSRFPMYIQKCYIDAVHRMVPWAKYDTLVTEFIIYDYFKLLKISIINFFNAVIEMLFHYNVHSVLCNYSIFSFYKLKITKLFNRR